MSDESISQQEIVAIQEVKRRADLARSEAEKAVALSQLAEANAKNLILQVYNKYSIKVGEDQILDTGKIVRKQVETEAEAVETEEKVEE